MKIFNKIVLMSFLFSPFLVAAVIEVPTEQTATIQAGIDKALPGDTVLVHTGLYYETLDFKGKNIIVASTYLTTGDTTKIEFTNLHGNASNRIALFNKGEDSTAALIGFAIFHTYADSGGAIYCENSGPTIERNTFEFCGALYGGAIFCLNADPVIRNNTIDGHAEWGGGIYCSNSNARIINNRIRFCGYKYGAGVLCTDSSDCQIVNNYIGLNMGENGGGLYIDNASPSILGNTIESNTASGWQSHTGGGILISRSHSKIEGNLIKGNSADLGGGMHVTNCSLQIKNNEFSYNSGYKGAGALFAGSSQLCIQNNQFVKNKAWLNYGGAVQGSGDLRIYNNLFIENSADGGAGVFISGMNAELVNNTFAYNIADEGAAAYFLGTHKIINSIFWNDQTIEGAKNEIYDMNAELDITYSNIEGGYPGEGNLDTDPHFRDPENGNFHLMSTSHGDSVDSPCIDAGHPDIQDSLISEEWGLGTDRSDMGAYGGGYLLPTSVENIVLTPPQSIQLFQNYPNPFNPSTLIEYSLPVSEHVIIEVFNTVGQRIRILVKQHMSAGNHQVTLNGNSLPSGIYFYQMQAGEFTEVRKMVLLR